MSSLGKDYQNTDRSMRYLSFVSRIDSAEERWFMYHFKQ